MARSDLLVDLVDACGRAASSHAVGFFSRGRLAMARPAWQRRSPPKRWCPSTWCATRVWSRASWARRPPGWTPSSSSPAHAAACCSSTSSTPSRRNVLIRTRRARSNVWCPLCCCRSTGCRPTSSRSVPPTTQSCSIAAWRRFQLRLALVAPTRAQATVFLTTLSARMGGSLGLAPRTLADRLAGASYAELEQFAQDVRRRYVLGLPEATLDDVVRSRLMQWRTRVGR